MPIYNCSDATMHSVIAMNYLSGVISFKMLPDIYDAATDKFSYKFEITFNQDNVIKTKTLTYEDVKSYMRNLKNLADMLDTITDDITTGGDHETTH